MKRITTHWRSLQYLFLLGPLLLMAGLTAGVVSETWGPLTLGLVISGAVLIALWLILVLSLPTGRSGKWWQGRSAQAGGNAIAATLAVLIILGAINYLVFRHGTRVDLTENQIYSLAPQSQAVVRSLSNPVKIWVFTNDPNPSDQQLLENYRAAGNRFNFEFVDPQLRPGITQRFGVRSNGEVHIESGDRRRLLQTLNPQESLSEARLTNAIDQLSQNRSEKIYFLQGHGEHTLEAGRNSLSQAVAALKDKDFTPEPLDLTTRAEIPQDATVIVVAGPSRGLFPAEVTALKDFLKRGGSVFLMVDANSNPAVDALLKEWGVRLDNRLAIDNSGKGRVVGLGPEVMIIQQYGQHPITQDFGNNISFYPLARSIETSPLKGVEETPLLISDAESWAESDLKSDELTFDAKSDRKGPLNLGVALSRKYGYSPTPNAPQQPVEARLVVFGNSTFATDGLFEQQLNSDVFLNSVTWLSKRDTAALSIRPRETRNRRINLNNQQANLISWLALAIFPLTGFSLAAFLWWKRR